jgi:hypothetical protein
VNYSSYALHVYIKDLEWVLGSVKDHLSGFPSL